MQSVRAILLVKSASPFGEVLLMTWSNRTSGGAEAIVAPQSFLSLRIMLAGLIIEANRYISGSLLIRKLLVANVAKSDA